MSNEAPSDLRSITLTADEIELLQWAVADAIAALLVRLDHCNADLNSRPLLKRRYDRLVDAGRTIGMNL